MSRTDGLNLKETTMIENAKRMSCGHCGGQSFAIYTAANLVVECLKCHNTSVLVVATPTIEIEFGPSSEGRLCVLS